MASVEWLMVLHMRAVNMVASTSDENTHFKYQLHFYSADFAQVYLYIPSFAISFSYRYAIDDFVDFFLFFFFFHLFDSSEEANCRFYLCLFCWSIQKGEKNDEEINFPE